MGDSQRFPSGPATMAETEAAISAVPVHREAVTESTPARFWM